MVCIILISLRDSHIISAFYTFLSSVPSVMFLAMQRLKPKQCGHCPAMNNQPHMVHRPGFLIQFDRVILKLSI